MNVRVAAYQAPLATTDPREVVADIRGQLDRCEREAVDILCCPEAVIGGLGDASATPTRHALGVANGELASILSPLCSRTVTTIVGFSEQGADGQLFNAAAVLHGGSVLGVYRKNRPAIRRSVYSAGTELPVFRVGDLTFGILICNDSNFPELARSLVDRGAQVIFIPSNNGLPPSKADVVTETRCADAAMARALGVAVVRADVAGRTEALVAFGTSGITGPGGDVRQIAPAFSAALLIADISLELARADPTPPISAT